VPGFVSDASGLQKVLSALYIFLFGLALRNMLKMKRCQLPELPAAPAAGPPGQRAGRILPP
jgi:hypothetical protein